MPPDYSEDDAPPEPEAGDAITDDPAPRRSVWRIVLPVLAVLVLALCGVGGYFLAAHMATPATQAVTPESKPAADPKLTETLSADAPAKPAQPQPQPQTPAAPASDAKLTAERFEGWFVVCPVDQPNSPDCTAQQQLRSAQSKALVFVWALRRDDKGVHAVWQTPPGVDAARGMILDAGDSKPRTVPIASCDAKSCVVRGLLAPDYLKTLIGAQTITATISMAADGKALRYAFSPKGLGAALARIGG